MAGGTVLFSDSPESLMTAISHSSMLLKSKTYLISSEWVLMKASTSKACFSLCVRVPLTQMSFYRDREPWQPWQLNSKYDHLQLVLIFEKNFFSCQAPKRNFRIAVAVSLIFETRKVPKFVFLLLSIRFFHKLVSTCIDDAADLIHSQLLLQFRKFSITFPFEQNFIEWITRSVLL